MSEEYVDQSSMVSDFFSDTSNLVYQETGESFNAPTNDQNTNQNNNAQTAVNPQQQIDNSQQVQPNQQQPTNDQVANEQQVQPQQPTVEPGNAQNEDPLAFMMDVNSEGQQEFSPLKAMDFLQRKNNQGEVQQGFTAPEPTVSEPTQPSAEAFSYPDAVRANYNYAFDTMEALMKQGLTLESAFMNARQMAANEANSAIGKYELDRRDEKLREEFAREKTEKTEADELKEASPKSIANLHEMAITQGYGTIDNLRNLLMHKDYGAPIINYLFNKDMGDRKFTSKEELATVMNNWFTKLTADKQALGFVEEIVRAKTFTNNKQRYIDHIRSLQEKQTVSNNHGKSMPGASVQNQNRQPAAPQNSIGNMLGLTQV